MPTTIASTIDIDAPRDRVWAILGDFARYPAWSPFLVRIDGEVRVGEAVALQVAMREGGPLTRSVEVVTKLEPGHEVCWGMTMGAPAFLRADRFQRLTELGPSRTRYETADTFTGLLVPLVMALYGGAIQRGFDATARALKAQAEGVADR